MELEPLLRLSSVHRRTRKNLELGNLQISDIENWIPEKYLHFVWKRSIVLNFGCGSQPRVNPLSLKTRWRRVRGIFDEFFMQMPDDTRSGVDLSDLDKISPN